MKNKREIFDHVASGDVSAIKNWFIACRDTTNVTDFRDMNDNTALSVACSLPNSESVVNVLLDLGFSCRVQNAVGETPLHQAVSVNNIGVVTILFSKCGKQLDVNCANDYGNTALHYACKRGLLQIAVLLLRNHAMYNIENNLQKTPLDCCLPQFLSEINASDPSLLKVRHARIPSVNCRKQSEGRVLARNRFIAQGGVPIGISYPLLRQTKVRATSRKFVTFHAEYLDSDVVVKQSLAQFGDNEKATKQAFEVFKREVQELRSLSHHNLLPILGIIEEPTNSTLAVVTEFSSYVPLGDQHMTPQQLLNTPSNLRDYLQDPSVELSQQSAVKLLVDICKGLEYLHRVELTAGRGFHGNLKSTNVLLKPGPTAILTDYGFSRSKFNATFDQVYLTDVTYMPPELLRDNALFAGKRVTVAESNLKSMQNALATSNFSDTTVGMKRWLAANRPASEIANRTTLTTMTAAKLANSNFCFNDPESTSGKCQAADVYSFGILMWEVIMRQFPYHMYAASKNSVANPTLLALKVLVESIRPDIPSYVPESLAEVMTSCWAELAIQRPTASRVLQKLNDISLPDEEY